ncbi:MAG: redoxin domain-containing protein [Actinomycetota bacterium]
MGRARRLLPLGFVLLGIAIVVAATRLDFLQGKTPRGGERRDPAPEFTGIDGWLNTQPLTLRKLRGKVVLIDFWAYSCVNCVRTFPALRQMYARYQPFGLEIVGVHAPEFTFEKSASNVQDAIRRNNLPWPVALDNEMATWAAYDNHYWPHVYLIDAKGQIRFDHIGEGGDDLIQTRLRALLTENGASLPAPVDFSETSLTARLTPEIYAGYQRGSVERTIGNPEGYRPEQIVDYARVPAGAINDAGSGGTVFLTGKWRATDEYLEAAEDGARLDLRLLARDVFFVAAAPSPAQVRLTLDGKTVTAADLGADAAGGVVRVSRSDLYRLIALDRAGEHTLTLTAEKGFRLYTFTFG